MSPARERILEEARSWLGTPFHNCASVKGAGVDCVHFMKAVYAACGVIEDFTIDQYAPQWFLHKDEPLFLNGLARYADRIEKAAALPADAIMYNLGRHAAHCAIIVDERTIIHAYSRARCVTLSDRGALEGREDSFWRVRGLA